MKYNLPDRVLKDIIAKAKEYGIEEDEIYRTGIVGQFHPTFELAWKSLQEILQIHSVTGSEAGAWRRHLGAVNCDSVSKARFSAVSGANRALFF